MVEPASFHISSYVLLIFHIYEHTHTHTHTHIHTHTHNHWQKQSLEIRHIPSCWQFVPGWKCMPFACCCSIQYIVVMYLPTSYVFTYISMLVIDLNHGRKLCRWISWHSGNWYDTKFFTEYPVYSIITHSVCNNPGVYMYVCSPYAVCTSTSVVGKACTYIHDMYLHECRHTSLLYIVHIVRCR